MKTLSHTIILFAIFVLLGCSNRGSGPLDLVRAHIDALNREDMAATLATLDSESPGFEATKTAISQIFQSHDLRYTIENMEIDSVNDDEARVRIVQTTEKIAGPAFRNNRIKAI